MSSLSKGTWFCCADGLLCGLGDWMLLAGDCIYVVFCAVLGMVLFLLMLMLVVELEGGIRVLSPAMKLGNMREKKVC